KRKTKRSRSVGSIVYRCAWQSIVIDRVSIDPVTAFFCYDQQVAVVTKANLRGVGRDAAYQRLSRAGQWCQRSVLVEVETGNIGSSTLVEYVEEIFFGEARANGRKAS